MKYKAKETVYNQGNPDNEKEVSVRLVAFRDGDMGLEVDGLIVLYLMSDGTIMVSQNIGELLSEIGFQVEKNRISVRGL